MADFNAKISTIREDLDALLGTIRNVETELHQATESFADLASNAKDISTLTSAIQKLGKFLDSNKSPFLDEIRDRVKTINTELGKLNVGQLQVATTALEANAKAMAAISRAQANTNKNLEAASTAISVIRTDLEQLESQSSRSGKGLDEAVDRISASLEKINGLTNLGAGVTALNQLDPKKYTDAADALDRVLKTLQALKSVNISIDVSAATEGQKLAKRPIQPVVQAPTIELPAATVAARVTKPPQAAARTIQFAEERGVDISQVTGTGARGKVTKDDILAHLKNTVPTTDPAAAAAKVDELRGALEKRVALISKLDDALAAVETARDKAFQAAVREHGVAKTSSQRAIARNYLLFGNDPNISPNEQRDRKLDFEQIRKNKTFDDLETGFQRQLRDIPVATNLPGDLSEFKANDTKLINTIKQLRESAAKEAERLSKEIEQGPSFALSHTFNALRKRKDTPDPSQIQITPEAENRVRLDTRTGAYVTKGNGLVGGSVEEANANLAAVSKAVDESPHKIAVVTTLGSTGGGASLIPGAGVADHVLLFFRDLEGKLQALEHLGDKNNLTPGNKTGSVAFGAYAPERRTPEEILAQADSVKALSLVAGTPEQAQGLLQHQAALTEPGKAVYSFANELNKSDLLDIGDTCATATAEAFKRSGIIETIEQAAKFNKVPGTAGKNLLTPDEVLEQVSAAQGTLAGGSKLGLLKQQALLALPGYGISAQYAANAGRGYAQGAFEGEFNNTAAIGKIDRNPFTQQYNTHGDKVVGTSESDASANRLALLSAIAASEHGVAIVGVSGRSSGGKSASNYDALDPKASADHALAVFLENGVIKVAELLNNGGTGFTGKTVTGKEAPLGLHPGADSFEDILRTWDRVQAVPLNGVTSEQAEQFKTNLVANTQEGAAYGLTKTIDEASGKLIGESCATAIAKSGRDAGILSKDYGLANAVGENTLQPSSLLKVFAAKNEEYRRAGGVDKTPDVAEIDQNIEHLSKEFTSLDDEYQKIVSTRRQLLEEIIAKDENLKADLNDLHEQGQIKDIPGFVDQVSRANYNSKSIKGHGAAAYYASALGITDFYEDKGVGDTTLQPVSDKRANTADLLDIERAKKQATLLAQQDKVLLQNTRPTTSVAAEEDFAKFVGNTLGRVDVIKNDVTSARTRIKEYVQQFVASFKDIFSRVGETFSDLFSSIGKISFGDIAEKVKSYFRGPQQGEAAPAFALTDNIGDATNKFSKNVYRPFSFGVSQFGAGLNSVREISNGFKEGGPGGALDIIGGIIKFLHTISNSNAFFGLKLLPKGVGELFNQRRSETLLDIAETAVGVGTGYRRSPIDRTARRLRADEAQLSERVNTRKEDLQKAQDAGASDEVILALRQELAKDTEELKQLRSQITAYRIVLAREEEEESRRKGGPSTGKQLDPDEATPEFALGANQHLARFLSDNDKQLSEQARASLDKFGENTGFSRASANGVTVASDATVNEILKAAWQGDRAPNTRLRPDQIGGTRLPGLGIVSKVRDAQLLAHEGTHQIVEEYGKLHSGGVHANLATQDLQYRDPADIDERIKLRGEVDDPTSKRILRQYSPFDKFSQKYYENPSEQYAYVGQSLITGNKDLEKTLRHIYGEDLYNQLVKDLQTAIPDTFGEEALAILRSRFAVFDAEFTKIASSTETTPEFSRDIHESTLDAYGKVKPFVGERESLLTRQANESLNRFSAGSGLQQGIGGGVVVVDQKNALAATRQFFSDQAIGNVKNNQIQGLSAPILDELGKRVSSLILTTTGDVGAGRSRAGILVHEATHELVDDQGRKGKALYTGTNAADLAFADQGLETKRKQRYADLAQGGNLDQKSEYLLDPREAFAHVGEALISGSAKLEEELRKVYGDDLYNDVVKTLEATLPDTFAPQYLAGLQAKFAQFSLEIETIFKNTGPDVTQAKTDLSKAIDQIFSGLNIGPAFGKGLGDKLQAIVPGVADVASNPESLKRLAQAAQPLLYNADSFRGRAISAIGQAGGADIAKQAFSTLQEPNQENVSALLAQVKGSPQIIQKALGKYIAETLNINEDILKLVPTKGVSPGKIAGIILNQYYPDENNFRDIANEKIQKLTGRNLREGSFQQQSSIDPATGIERFTLSARTATGAMISLNGHVDEFGHKKLDEPEKAVSRFGAALHQVTIGGLRQIGDNFTYGIVNSFQEMFRQLVGVQDELGEVANLLGVVGDKATQAKSKFLFQSVGVAVKTGQGFDEAIQTNLKNFKILGSVKDPTQRAELANQVSEVQLGAQTAFGISLEQSLESIPAILATIKDGMEGIDDPAQKVTRSIEDLRDVMDQVVIAQRTTGAQGDELLTVYSRLSASAKEYGLNSKQLLGITATSSVAIGKGSDETSNILRSFLEGTYSSANQSSFAKNGIATQQFNQNTNQLENRSFEDILKDLYKLSQDKSKSIDYNQLIQSIAGPKLSPDISKVIQGFGNNYANVESSLDQTPKGVAQQLVAQKSQTFAGSLNKLQATGTQFLGSFLVGTGGFDSAAKLFDTLSASAVKLTGFLNDNEGSIKKVVAALAPFIKFFTVGFASKDLNIFSPLAKGIQGLETRFSGTLSKLTDFGRVGESSTTRLQKVLNLLGVALEELDGALLKTGNTGSAAFAKIAETATVAKNAVATDAAAGAAPAFALTQAGALVEKETPLNARLGNKTLNTSGITETDLAQIRGQAIEPSFLRSNADDLIATASQPSRLSQLRQSLQKPGAAAGAIAAPVAFDLISGGLGKDNLTNVGVGIAAGIAGGMVGGPYGAIIGYSIAKTISENLDVSGKLGTSEQESKTFAEKLAEAVYNKKPPNESVDVTPADKAAAATKLNGLSKTLGIGDLQSNLLKANTNPFVDISTQISSASVRRYLDIQSGKTQGNFLDNFKNNAPTEQLVGAFGGNKQLLNLFADSGVSNVQEFLQLLDQASKGLGPLAEDFSKLSVETRQQAVASQAVTDNDVKRAQYESAQDIIQKGQQQQADLEAKLQNNYQTPYGLDKYNAFSPLAQSINQSFQPDLNKINSGALKGQDAQGALDRLARSQESLAALPQTLQQLVPLAQSLGLNTGGLEQRLYNVGSQGQSQIAQRFQPAIEADRSVQLYELQQSRLRSLQSTDQFKAKQPEIVKEVEALQKALATDKARYDINKAFLELLKSQSGALLDQTAQVEAQQKTRQLISAGTPAQFTPASIFDTKGTTATELNNAIDFALRKQSKLEALNPEYKKEFAKDQFLLQSGTDFKGVTGVNQGFVQEYLQQQQQKKEAPLQDLSQYSDQQIQKILEQARSLQGQAEKLDPNRAGKYENERILILKKNNELLSQTGIGQEFLKAAIDANTKSNDTLRGHYNLPSNYKQPTIFDYYDSGGKEKGDKNFPTLAGQGLVPLAFAQQLAQQLINGDNGDKGASLSDVKGTNQKGARPLFYPNPGTAAVYSEVEPQIIPDTIKSDQKISAAVQRFLDFKQKQIDDLNDASSKDKLPPDTGIEDIRLRNAERNKPIPPKDAGVQAAYNQLVNPNQPFFGAPKPADVIQGTTVLAPTGTLPPQLPPGKPTTNPGNTDRDRDLSGPVVDGAEKTKTSLSTLAQSSGKTKDDLAILGTNAAKTGTAIGTIATALPAAGVGAASLITSASAFNGAVTALIQKVQNFDLAQALKNANVNIQVTVNGQVTQPAQVTINSGTAVGPNTLSAGVAAKTGSKLGGNRQ